MYNLGNLNDYDFEILCRDIAERKLGILLRNFAKGRDGGIDITDSVIEKNVILQAKHYMRSIFANLRRSLQDEKKKILELNPKQYYVYTSLSLSPDNVKEIYNMFSDYMESEDNIMGLESIQKYLDEHTDIVESHYKLWLESSKILTRLYNNSVFIDCEALTHDIEAQAKTFVKTVYYSECIKILEKDRTLLLLGNPGVGKTMTSKMVLLHFAERGYAVRYSADLNLQSIKNALDVNPERKEIILLDDCFGQIYFDMKATQPNELIRLIQYVTMHQNKILLMNSRITVFKEAESKSVEWHCFVENEKILIRHLVINNISDLEKAKILYNRMCSQALSSEYWECLKSGQQYLSIVKHTNYSPRIIEHITSRGVIKNVAAKDYVAYVLDCLNNPKEIWEDEYRNRLKDVDRILLNTLFSMTDKYVSMSRLRNVFAYRILNSQKFDTTENLWESVLHRLKESMVKTIEVDGEICIGVINPSVNDYLKEKLDSNAVEKEEIKRYSCDSMQIQRGFSPCNTELITSHRIKEFVFSDSNEMLCYVVSVIGRHEILDSSYRNAILQYLKTFPKMRVSSLYCSRDILLGWLTTSKIVEFYDLKEVMTSDIMESILNSMDLDEYITFVEDGISEDCADFFEYNETKIVNGINKAILEYVEYQVEPVELVWDKSPDTVLTDSTYYSYLSEPQEYEDDVATELIDYIYDSLNQKISGLLELLPYPDYKFYQLENEPLQSIFEEMTAKLDVEECMDYLQRNTSEYYADMAYEQYRDNFGDSDKAISEIDYLFK